MQCCEEKRRWYLATVAHQRQQAELAANLRAVEILHKYAMTTKDTHALGLIEAAQKEILEGGEGDLATVRGQAVAEFAREVRRKIRDKAVDDRFIHALDLEVMIDESLEERGIDLNTLKS